MSDQKVQEIVREALVELQRYLSDDLAPMMVADSFELLMRYPPELVANEIEGWVGAQSSRPGEAVAVSDYIFHALKKMYLMSEFDLISKEQMVSYLEGVSQHVLPFCPEEDRQLLLENLGRLGKAEAGTMASPVEVVHRQSGGKGAQAQTRASAEAPAASAAATATATSAELSRGMKQFSLLVDRLGGQSQATAAGGASAAKQEELRTQILTTAAVGARDSSQFEQHRSQLAGLGVNADLGEIFRSLGRSLPGWVVPAAATGGSEGAPPIPASRSSRALQRIMSMAANPEEGAERFNEMVQAAIEQFNEGHLVQAMTMLELATRIIDEKKLQADVVKATRERLQTKLQEEQLRRYADDPAKHEALRRVMDFFPAFGPHGLLSDLNGETKRERRKILLALLEAHGGSARVVAFTQLKTLVNGDSMNANGYFERNLIFLLRRIPRDAASLLDEELELFVQLSGLENPLIVLRETIRALGQTKHPRAEAALSACLLELEALLIKGEPEPHGAAEQRKLLEQTISALTHLGTPNALRSVANHAFKSQSQLGNTMARLAKLGYQDLSVDRELVARMVKALDQELPSKVLGITVGKKNRNIDCLLQALSCTTAPAVRQKLEEIVQRFPGEGFTAKAAKVLEGLGIKVRTDEAPAKTMTGDLELFGLPNLLQSLADSKVTGNLALLDRENEPMGTLIFGDGQIVASRVGPLGGETAFYQLFERPMPGTFIFTSQSAAAVKKEAKGEPLEIMPSMLEAMRRHDEFNQARALAPDDVPLKPTDTKPTALRDEEDTAMMKMVWSKAAAGQTPAQCEAAVQADSYSIRRLYMYWIEQGSLIPQ
jgi:hypothetical protein